MKITGNIWVHHVASFYWIKHVIVLLFGIYAHFSHAFFDPITCCMSLINVKVNKHWFSTLDVTYAIFGPIGCYHVINQCYISWALEKLAYILPLDLDLCEFCFVQSSPFWPWFLSFLRFSRLLNSFITSQLQSKTPIMSKLMILPFISFLRILAILSLKMLYVLLSNFLLIVELPKYLWST